jgi:ATP-dependent Clp protease adaptor protein ClpS
MSLDKPTNQSGTAVLARTKVKVPKMYKVLIHNDDFTPMDFVVEVLQKIFSKTYEDATKIMLDVHYNGFGICGIYTYDVAETKTVLVAETAKENEVPLRCSFEEA